MTTASEVWPAGEAEVSVFAPAKINLSLHVTGRRADGYHLLDSLVMFADIGDRLTLRPAARASLRIFGPRAEGLSDGPDNLALQAAAFFGEPVEIVLEKHLPREAGIGGGSADAAAVLRGLASATGRAVPPGSEKLGADVPVCLVSRAARMAGVGEAVTPLPGLPALDAVLVTPGALLSTPQVFAGLAGRENPPMPGMLPAFAGAHDLIDFLSRQRNDLEPPARMLTPAVTEALETLAAAPACRLARMSGSGSTCFGLFPDAASARAASAALMAQRPDWWVEPVRLG